MLSMTAGERVVGASLSKFLGGDGDYPLHHTGTAKHRPSPPPTTTTTLLATPHHDLDDLNVVRRTNPTAKGQ